MIPCCLDWFVCLVAFRVLAALLPAAVFALAVRAVRPAATVTAPGRLAVVRGTLVTAAFAVGSVEALSDSGLLTVAGVVGTWLVALVVAAIAATCRGGVPAGATWRVSGARWRVSGARWRVSGATWRTFVGWERVLLLVLGGLVLAELVIALKSPPNTFDGQTYHLPRVEHWVVNRSVDPDPVRIHRQVTYPPGAEYLLLHLRLLTGGDRPYALVQFGAGVLALLAVTRITAQLGGGRRAQLLSAFVLGTVPAFVLESTGTHTDLVMAVYVASLATIALDGTPGADQPTASARLTTSLLFGCAVGLIGLTKPTGLPVAAALVVWWMLAWLRRGRYRAVPGVLGTGLGVILGTALLAGPQLWRVNAEFGNPLGPDYLRDSVAMQRHDPGSVLVNALRQAHTVLDTPIRPLSRAGAAGIVTIARAIDVDPQDPTITFPSSTFPTVAWYPSEDKASYPVQALLLAIATIAVLVRPGRRLPGRRRIFAGILVLSALLHTAVLKWQPWGNRLILFLVVLAAPLAGLWLTSLWRAPARGETAPGRCMATRPERCGRPVIAWLAALAVLTGGAAGWMSAGYGWPRRLIGSGSVFVLDEWDARFATRPQWADDYSTVAAAVRGSGARRIGLVQGNDTWEYPWWLLFKGRELVALQSQLPRRRPGTAAQVDALVCAAPPGICQSYAPRTWTFRTVGILSLSQPRFCR
jgi:hypothetical protein